MTNPNELARQLLICITPLLTQPAPATAPDHHHEPTCPARALQQHIWASVQHTLQSNPEAAAILQLYQTRPDHPSYQHLLMEQIQTHLAHNETATAELTDLLHQWHQATGQQTTADQIIEAANIKDSAQQATSYDRIRQHATAAQDIVGFKQQAVRRPHHSPPPAPPPHHTPPAAAPPAPPAPTEHHPIDPRRLREAMCSVYPRDKFELLCLDLGTSYDRLRGDTLETRIAYLIEDYRRSSRYNKLVQHVLSDYPHLREKLLPDI